MGPQRMLPIAMVTVSLVVIAVGGVLFFSGSEVGLIVAAFGLLDLLTLPFVLRLISRSPDAGSSAPEPAPIDPTADPSYNPYARED